jgi:hypothetical protein
MRGHHGDATFASLAALKGFLEMEPEIEEHICTTPAGKKEFRRPGAKEGELTKVRFHVAAGVLNVYQRHKGTSVCFHFDIFVPARARAS